MSFGDSTAVFKKRAAAVGLSAAIVGRFEANGITTMAVLAFACNYNPSHADDSSLKQLANTVLGRDATLVEMSGIRRLFNEACAAVASDIRLQAEQTEDSAVRRLAPADRAERLKTQQERFRGISMRGCTSRGGSLVGKCVAMYEAESSTSHGVPRWLESTSFCTPPSTISCWRLTPPATSRSTSVRMRRFATPAMRYLSEIAWSEGRWRSTRLTSSHSSTWTHGPTSCLRCVLRNRRQATAVSPTNSLSLPTSACSYC